MYAAQGQTRSQSSSVFDFAADCVEIARNRKTWRQNVIEHFIASLPKTFQSFQKSGLAISDRYWQKIDLSISCILQNQTLSQELLSHVKTIETLSGHRFHKLGDKVAPILLKGPDGMEIIVAKSNLRSHVFQSILRSKFQEAEKGEISLKNMSPSGFTTFVTLLRNINAPIPPAYRLELLKAAHTYAHVPIFHVVFSELVKELQSQEKSSVDQGLLEAVQFLSFIFGIGKKRAESCQEMETGQNMLQRLFSFFWPEMTFPPDERCPCTLQECAQRNKIDSNLRTKTKDQVYQDNLLSLLTTFGKLFEEGWCIEKDISAALKLYSFGSKLGNDDAQCRMGHCYEKGIGAPKYEALAFEFYILSANQGSASGQAHFGHCCEKGIGTQVDLNLAFSFYNEAVKKNNADGQFFLGEFNERWNSKEGREKAFELYKLAADQGHVGALTAVARLYHERVPENEKLSTKYYLLAASRGYAPAQYGLAFKYKYGVGVSKDLQQMIRYYSLAADQKYAPAQYALGDCYLWGNGVDKDPVQGVKYLQLSADQGDVEAQNDLGVCYEQGVGIPIDLNKAQHYLQLAVDQAPPHQKIWFFEMAARNLARVQKELAR